MERREGTAAHGSGGKFQAEIVAVQYFVPAPYRNFVDCETCANFSTVRHFSFLVALSVYTGVINNRLHQSHSCSTLLTAVWKCVQRIHLPLHISLLHRQHALKLVRVIVHVHHDGLHLRVRRPVVAKVLEQRLGVHELVNVHGATRDSRVLKKGEWAKGRGGRIRQLF